MDIKKFTELITDQFLEEDQDKVTPEIRFRELETWDSLTGMAVLTIINDECGVNIPVDEFRLMDTINELFEYVQKQS